jgi:hypothetical protein
MVKILKFDEFLRAVDISKNHTYSLLLGAGCSISSDIPSAEDCIWEWKRTIYKSNNVISQGWIDNYRNPKVQNVIQIWLDNQGEYIEAGSKDEYSFYAKKCFPIQEHRRQYFQKICTNKIPAIGYRTIPILMKQGILDSVWTTNFDDLVMNACVRGGVQSIEMSLDAVQRLNQRGQSRNELPVIKLHGDFKYGELKNTNDELQKQDATFRNKLIEYIQDKNLIIIGYSGRDYSLMETLREAYSQNGGGMLFWCGYGNSIPKEVEELLNFASQKRQAFYVPTDGFDTTMLNITKLVIEGNENLKKELLEIQQNDTTEKAIVPFSLDPTRINKILKSNCYEIKFPEEIFIFDSKDNSWLFVKEMI